jgi:circadian clock protein KaiB
MSFKKRKRKPSRVLAADDAEQFEQLLRRTQKRARYVLKLYTTGNTYRSSAAIANIRSLCDDYLPGRYDLEVVDIYQQPAEAVSQQIIAAPTLVKHFPRPVRRMIGDLADRQRVLVGLGLL